MILRFSGWPCFTCVIYLPMNENNKAFEIRWFLFLVKRVDSNADKAQAITCLTWIFFLLQAASLNWLNHRLFTITTCVVKYKFYTKKNVRKSMCCPTFKMVFFTCTWCISSRVWTSICGYLVGYQLFATIIPWILIMCRGEKMNLFLWMLQHLVFNKQR